MNLRSDPFERAFHESIGYDLWLIDHLFLLVPAQAFVGNFLSSFQEFPPRQNPASFTIDQVMQKLQQTDAHEQQREICGVRPISRRPVGSRACGSFSSLATETGRLLGQRG
jgi:hypothetical protein